MVEEALRQTIKISLQEISRAVGDGKSETIPFLQVNVVLEMQKVDFQPTFEELVQMVNHVAKELIVSISVIPRLSELKKKEEAAIAEAEKAEAARNAEPPATEANGVPNGLPNGNHADGSSSHRSASTNTTTTEEEERSKLIIDENKRPSFYELIAKDEDTLKIFSNIVNSMTANVEKLAVWSLSCNPHMLLIFNLEIFVHMG